ncbi:MAG TPA: hypothetical protein ENJ84_12860 [Gammaproteobacteria bacterium]|nr:hypothetical protein [Gammaproteobacteria bacterium]
MNIKKCLIGALAFLPGFVYAGNDLDSIQDLAQDQFRILAENLVAATSYKALAPAEPLGILGFDVGVELTTTDLNKDIFEIASAANWDYSFLPLAKLHAHKGLPFNLDVGAFYTSVPDTDIKVFGAELRYALLEGSIATPAVAVRLSYSKMDGIDQLELDNKGIDVSISKGFAMLTPYAGVGRVFSTVKPVGIDLLKTEDIEEAKVFAGININLGINLAFEVDRTAGINSYSAKVGLRF